MKNDGELGTSYAFSWSVVILRRAILLLILCSQLTLGWNMNAKAKGTDESPPLSPVGEKGAPNDPDFAAACLARVHYLAPNGHWILGEPLLTHSDRWGLVWRVDFKYPHDDLAPLVNRVICWRTDDGNGVNAEIAVGQHVAPLNVPPRAP